jgi:hypothetical protein
MMQCSSLFGEVRNEFICIVTDVFHFFPTPTAEEDIEGLADYIKCKYLLLLTVYSLTLLNQSIRGATALTNLGRLSSRR